MRVARRPGSARWRPTTNQRRSISLALGLWLGPQHHFCPLVGAGRGRRAQAQPPAATAPSGRDSSASRRSSADQRPPRPTRMRAAARLRTIWRRKASPITSIVMRRPSLRTRTPWRVRIGCQSAAPKAVKSCRPSRTSAASAIAAVSSGRRTPSAVRSRSGLRGPFQTVYRYALYRAALRGCHRPPRATARAGRRPSGRSVPHAAGQPLVRHVPHGEGDDLTVMDTGIRAAGSGDAERPWPETVVSAASSAWTVRRPEVGTGSRRSASSSSTVRRTARGGLSAGMAEPVLSAELDLDVGGVTDALHAHEARVSQRCGRRSGARSSVNNLSTTSGSSGSWATTAPGAQGALLGQGDDPLDDPRTSLAFASVVLTCSRSARRPRLGLRCGAMRVLYGPLAPCDSGWPWLRLPRPRTALRRPPGRPLRGPQVVVERRLEAGLLRRDEAAHDEALLHLVERLPPRSCACAGGRRRTAAAGAGRP